jgi:hypothetical protein
MNKTISHLHMFKKIKLTHRCFKFHRPFGTAELTVWIFFIFWPNKIRISPTIVSSLSPFLCRLSSVWCRHTATPCHASFTWSQHELAASASSFSNASSRHLSSRAETEALNPYHRPRPSSPDRLTPTLHCYKRVITTLTSLLTTQTRLHFASLLARAIHHQSSTRRCRSLSPPSCTHRPSTQWHQWRWTSWPSFASRTAYWHVNSRKKIF